MATKIMFDRPYGTLCAFEMATPPSDHIIIGQIVAVSERPGKFLIILISTLKRQSNGHQWQPKSSLKDPTVPYVLLKWRLLRATISSLGWIVAVSERPGKFLIILISHYVAAGYHP